MHRENILDGKVAIVTGAVRNFGKAIAKGLLEAGAFVAINDCDREALEITTDELAQITGDRHSILDVLGDISVETEVDSLIGSVINHFGRLDVLINNAALKGGKPFLEYPITEIDRMIAVNLRGVLLCSQRASRVMAESGKGGSIIQIGSVNSARASASAVVYASCKGALDAGTRAMAVDLVPDPKIFAM